MQTILFYRELDFSLKSISEILSSPNYNINQALKEQKELLTLKKQRLERLIAAVDDAMKGDFVMSAFDNSQFEQYKAEATERWGQTEAYRQHRAKTEHYSRQKWDDLAQGMDHIMADFALCMKSGAAPDSPDAAALVKTLQEYITENYYHCTDQILAGLGQMYVADDRFRANIDRHGSGTAAFISSAIEHCCK